jgi:hypothetical protein
MSREIASRAAAEPFTHTVKIEAIHQSTDIGGNEMTTIGDICALANREVSQVADALHERMATAETVPIDELRELAAKLEHEAGMPREEADRKARQALAQLSKNA